MIGIYLKLVPGSSAERLLRGETNAGLAAGIRKIEERGANDLTNVASTDPREQVSL